jgi:hypothetical protein
MEPRDGGFTCYGTLEGHVTRKQNTGTYSSVGTGNSDPFTGQLLAENARWKTAVKVKTTYGLRVYTLVKLNPSHTILNEKARVAQI